MTLKSGYISTLDESGQAMCADLITGEPAVVATTELSVVRSEKNNFQSVDTMYMDMACTGCGLKATAKMLLGTAMKSKFQSWNCSTNKKCSGVCVVSSQVKSHKYMAVCLI